MNSKKPATCTEVYTFYSDVVKPIYSHIEAIQNKLPIELLFEIHSAFDHLKRFHVDGVSEADCANAAYGHLKRGVLDAFKIDLKVFNDTIEVIQNNCDLSLIDNGTYLNDFVEKKHEIYELAKDARLNVTTNNLDDVFEKWSMVSLKIDQFRKEMIRNKKVSFEWANKTKKKIVTKETVVAFIIGLVSSALVATIFFFISNSNSLSLLNLQISST